MSRTSKAAMIGLRLLAAGSVGAFVTSPVLAQEAEVTLRLVNPANPGLLLVNDSDIEAKGISYAFGLWNADNLREGYKMLPIPRSGLDRLASHSKYGPINVFDMPEVRPWLASGNRIVGGIAVHCGNCARGYTYWVLITWGKDGWFSEIRGKTNGALIAPRYTDSDDIMRDAELSGALLQMAAEVEQKDRIPIAPYIPSERTWMPADTAPAR